MKMYQKLIDTFKDKESQKDNQEVLQLLFALKNDLPLKNCSTQAKVLKHFFLLFSAITLEILITAHLQTHN